MARDTTPSVKSESPPPSSSQGGNGARGAWEADGAGHGGMVLSRAMFASLAIPAFRLVWVSNLGMMFAMQMQMVARGWLIYDMTRSPVALAWVLFSMMGPMAVFSLLGGAIADRLRKKMVIMVSQTFNILSALVLGTIIVTGNVTFTHFIIFGLFNGIILPLSMPARQAIIPEIVGEEKLVNAIALNTASMNLSRILAPTLAGIIIAVMAGGDTSSAVGVGIIFYVIAGLYLMSILTLARLRDPGRPAMAEQHSLVGDMGAGLAYVWRSPALRGLLALAFIPLLFGMPIQFLMPAFNQDIMEMGPRGLGVLMGAMGVGALIGSLALASMGNMRSKGLLLLGSAMLWAVFLGLFGMSHSLPLTLPLLGIVGFFMTIYMAMNMTLVQLAAAPEMRGRVMSLIMMTFGLMPLGVFPMSILAEQIGIDIAILAAAVGLGVLTLAMAVANPAIRRIDLGYSAPLSGESSPQPQSGPAPDLASDRVSP